MNYLLDTHILIWYSNDDEALSAHIKDEISNGNNVCYASIASLWEISIKAGLGKLLLKRSIQEFATLLLKNNIIIIPLTIKHLEVYEKLPLHHKDPFDRILIAQSISESCTVITKDKAFAFYTVNVLS